MIQSTLHHLGRKAFGAMTHPVSTAAYAAGMARGVVRVGVGLVVPGGSPKPPAHQQAPDPRPAAGAATGPVAAEVVPAPKPGPNVAAAPQREPRDLAGEQVFTEPSAANRDSEHGSPGAETDVDWREVAAAEEDAAGAGATETDLEQPDTEPLLDPATAKSIRSESETLRRAAQRDPD